jgi:hypothetical protein
MDSKFGDIKRVRGHERYIFGNAAYAKSKRPIFKQRTAMISAAYFSACADDLRVGTASGTNSSAQADFFLKRLPGVQR